MFPSFPHGVTVTFVTRTLSGTDDYGNDTYTSTQFDVSPCSVQPATTSENPIMTEELVDDITVYAPTGTPVDYLSAVIWNGNTYEVNGRPNTWQSPFSGRLGPVQIQAHRQTGVSV
jgi:hypothetical protein